MLFSISSRDHYHGKDFQVVLKLRSMQILRKRRRRSQSMISAQDNRMNSRNSFTIAEVLDLLKTQTMNTL
jgi:hypothetical protein